MAGRVDIRIFRHPLSHYYRGDLDSVDLYTEAYLRRLGEHGFNAVWLQSAMRALVSFRSRPTARQSANMDRLRRLIERAARQGIRVFLYQNEPRALAHDDPFWRRYPEARGEPGRSGMDGLPNTLAMCTSTPVVRDFIHDAAAELYRQAAGLGGAFLITASEHHTHCYSHVIVRPGIVFASDTEHAGIQCPRCRERTATEIVAEVLNLYRDGVRDAGSRADVIAWNWSWVMYAADPQRDILRRLRKDIVLMADFERGGDRMLRGQRVPVDEYSLSYVGPSRRFTRIRSAGQALGHAVAAKLQLNATHELASVPNVPLPGVVHDKLSRLAKGKGKGFVGCWNFGSFFTLNTAAVGLFARTGAGPGREEFLARLAREHFGDVDTRGITRALAIFRGAFSLYPFDNRFLYFGPMNFAPGVPIRLHRQPRSPLTPSFVDLPRGNDWDACLGKFSLGRVIDLLGEIARRWEQGLAIYQRALFGQEGFRPFEWGALASEPAVPLRSPLMDVGSRLRALRRALPREAFHDVPALRTVEGLHRLEEWCSAFGVLACARSALNLLRTHRLHKRGPTARCREALRDVMREESGWVKQVIPILRLDARLGYHGECQAYLFDVRSCRSKLRIMQQDLADGNSDRGS